MNEYPIDTIMVLTIERAVNRHWALLGTAVQPLCGVPEELIHFYNGPDGRDYQNDMELAAAAAAADGFPWVEEYSIGLKTDYVQQTAALTCQIWSYAQILRYLVKTGQTGLIIWDDKTLKVPFTFFCDVLSMLKDAEKAFYMWQLTLRGHPEEIKLRDLDTYQRIKQSELTFNSVVKGDMTIPMNFLIEEGIKGYDESIVFSPAGAAWMLEKLANANDFHAFLDNFICNEMSGLSVEAGKDNKGFYSPTEYGYNFADVYMPLGTLTDWAHEESIHFGSSRESIGPRYIDLQKGATL